MAANGEINFLLNAKGNAQAVLKSLSSQLANFRTTFSAGFNLNLGAQTANLLLSLPGQFKAIARELDNLQTIAANANINVEAFQALAAIGAQANVSMEEIQKSITKIRAANQGFADQDGGIVRAFETLNIEGAKFAQLPLPLQLEALGAAYAKAGDSTDAFTALTTILGEKAGPKLQALLRSLGTEGFAKLAADAKDAGQVLNEETVNGIANLNDRLDELGKRIKNVFARFAEDFAPVAELFLNFANKLFALAERTEISFQRILRAMGGIVAVAKGDLSFSEANKLLEDAAAEDERKRLEPVKVGAKQTAPTADPQKLTANLRQRVLSEDEKAEVRFLTERGSALARESALQIAAIGRDFKLSSEQRKNATSAVLRAEMAELAQLQADLDAAIAKLPDTDPRKAKFIGARDNTSDQRTDATQQFLGTNAGPRGIAEGAQAGIAGASDRLGTTASNVAGAIEGSIGTAAQGVSDIILGWVTGARNFIDVIQNAGLSILQQFLDALISIGIQQVLNGNAAKAIAVGWKALTSGLRAADTAETVAAEATKTPVLATNAALSSASSFGVGAVIGIAALSLALGAFLAGFEQGGYTGAGPASKPAGIVHAGEYVLTQAEVNRLGIGRIEAFKGGRGYEGGGFVTGEATSAPVGGSPGRPVNFIAVDSRREAQRIAKNSEAESQIFDMIYNRRAELLGDRA